MLKLRPATFLCALALSLGAAALPASAKRHVDTEADLAARIARARNPVEKAKYEVRLGDLKLQQAIVAYGQSQFDPGAKLLDDYLAHMKAAWKLLKDSGHDATRKPAGFKQLDIALREDARQMQDLRGRLSYLDRGPLDAAANEIDRTHNEVLSALFPAHPPKH